MSTTIKYPTVGLRLGGNQFRDCPFFDITEKDMSRAFGVRFKCEDKDGNYGHGLSKDAAPIGRLGEIAVIEKFFGLVADLDRYKRGQQQNEDCTLLGKSIEVKTAHCNSGVNHCIMKDDTGWTYKMADGIYSDIYVCLYSTYSDSPYCKHQPDWLSQGPTPSRYGTIVVVGYVDKDFVRGIEPCKSTVDPKVINKDIL